MAIPQHNWTPDELSFIAEENVTIKITPQFSFGKVNFISGSFGPFEAGRSVKVPLWLALFFNSSNSCTLVPPSWLNTSTLNKILAREKEFKEELQKVPQYYMEVSFAFFNNANNVVKEADLVRSCIEDLWTIRTEKIRHIFSNSTYIKDLIFTTPNITRMEVHLFREPISNITSLTSTLYNKAIALNIQDDE